MASPSPTTATGFHDHGAAEGGGTHAIVSQVKEGHAAHLVVIGDREALRWVLESERIALPEPRYASQPRSFVVGDELFLYTTRGCFRNPTRDRGRVIGKATLTSDMARSGQPVVIGGRSFPYMAALRIETLAPIGDGVDMAGIAEELSCFPKSDRWAMYLRRSVVPLSLEDKQLIDRLLRPFVRTVDRNRESYKARTGPVLSANSRGSRKSQG